MDIYEAPAIEKHIPSIENTINLAIGDANGEVRHVTRQAFLLYEMRYPKRALKLKSKFDNAIQKALLDEANSDSFQPESISTNPKIRSVPTPNNANNTSLGTLNPPSYDSKPTATKKDGGPGGKPAINKDISQSAIKSGNTSSSIIKAPLPSGNDEKQAKRKLTSERDLSKNRDLSAMREGPKENKEPSQRPTSSSGKKKLSAKPLRESFETQPFTNTNELPRSPKQGRSNTTRAQMAANEIQSLVSKSIDKLPT